MPPNHKDADAKLTPAERELEHALRTLSPAAARLDAAAAVRESRRRFAHRQRRMRLVAVAALALIGGGAWLMFGPRPQRPQLVELPTPKVVEPRLAVVAPVAAEPPTLLAYRRALQQSPEDLSAMLDRQAIVAVRRETQSPPAEMLRSWHVNRHLTGDM